MKTNYFILIFMILGLFSCKSEGAQDPVIVSLDGCWEIQNQNVPNDTIEFDREGEMYSMFTYEHGEVWGTYSAIPCENNDSIYLDYFTEDEEYMDVICKIIYTTSESEIYITNLPYYEGETKKLIKF